METAIWIIVIGFFLYMMIFRGGCCGGHKHGKDQSSAKMIEKDQTNESKSPNCH